VFEAIDSEGEGLGLRLAGLNALDSLRAEVGYRRPGLDIGPVDDPVGTGLSRFVAMDEPGGVMGRYAVAARGWVARDDSCVRRWAFIRLESPESVLLGGQRVLVDGVVAGPGDQRRLRPQPGCRLRPGDHGPGSWPVWPGASPARVPVNVLCSDQPAQVSPRPFQLTAG
jgi:Aminomethyltransferase folate-binding domain